jgi:Heavy metal associated domain 2
LVLQTSARAYVAHRTPTRVRFKLPAQRNDRAFFRSLELRLSQRPGVRSVETNPATGSVLITHDEGLDIERLRQPFLDCWAAAIEPPAPMERGSSVVPFRPNARPSGVEALPAVEQSAAQQRRSDVDLAAIIVDIGMMAVTRQPPTRLIEWAATAVLRAAIEAAKRPRARYA